MLSIFPQKSFPCLMQPIPFDSFTVEGSESLWNKDPLTSISYQINSKSALTWHQARRSCQQQNAELLSITEIHEQTYLTGKDSKRKGSYK